MAMSRQDILATIGAIITSGNITDDGVGRVLNAIGSKASVREITQKLMSEGLVSRTSEGMYTINEQFEKLSTQPKKAINLARRLGVSLGSRPPVPPSGGSGRAAAIATAENAPVVTEKIKETVKDIVEKGTKSPGARTALMAAGRAVLPILATFVALDTIAGRPRREREQAATDLAAAPVRGQTSEAIQTALSGERAKSAGLSMASFEEGLESIIGGQASETAASIVRGQEKALGEIARTDQIRSAVLARALGVG